VATVTVVPITLSTLYNTFAENPQAAANGIKQRNISPQVESYRSKYKKKSFFTKRNIFLVAGWAIIAGLIYLISHTEISSTAVIFDPYELLGVDFGSSDKLIKSTYRKLSIKFHPDKLRGASEEEVKEMEDKFVLITKAYKALTDEVTKENYEKYGHPDGPQSTSHGIALPKFLVEGKSSPLLLAFYIVLIGGVLPYFVGSWWNQAKKVTKKGIYADTAEMFINKLMNQSPAKHVDMQTIMTWLSEASEYEDILPKKSPQEIAALYEKYLNREANDDALTAVSIVPTLINGLVDITANFRNTDVTLIASDTLKHFIQALPSNPKNELLQLPYVDPEAVAKSTVTKLGKLTTLPRDKIKETLGIKDDTQLNEALDVATHIPRLELISAKCEVPGESVVTPESTAFITIKVAVKSAKHHSKTTISKEELQDPQDMEALRAPLKVMEDQPRLPKSYSPWFPVEKQSGYIGYIILQRDGKICDQPAIFNNLDLSNLELSESEYKSGKNVKVGTFKFQMGQPTPKEIGKYHFRVVIKSLDYFTTDLDTTMAMNVEEPPKLEEVDQYGIPKPKEDSLAGAMATLRGEEVEKADDQSDDDESDLEEEEEDFTDINTDTEDEAE
jgi:translocation protein SEC63